MSQPPVPASSERLSPRERAAQALTFLVHEAGTSTVRLSGLTLADIHVDLETRLADAIAAAEEEALTAASQRIAALEAALQEITREAVLMTIRRNIDQEIADWHQQSGLDLPANGYAGSIAAMIWTKFQTPLFLLRDTLASSSAATQEQG